MPDYPKSEALEIGSVLRILHKAKKAWGTGESFALIEEAQDRLRELQEQAMKGHHRNPRRGRFQAGTVVGKIGDDVHDIRYTHADDGENYEHQFNGEVEVYAVERAGKRDLLLTHVRGLPLWDEF